ncbi:MAG: lysylphosphatidylglycerol synthase transmembrane domain-containing protein [Bacilli bacterium]|nr:lysylphosphatidylglycerol synthase transmembrane domain-containing protein [Bacilli bacterium]
MKNKKYLNIFILLIVSIVVIYIILKDNFVEIIDQIISVNPYWLVFSLILLIIYWVIKSMILYIVTKKFDDNYKYKKSLRLQILTQFFNAVTPFAAGGQPFQIYVLKQDGLTYHKSANVIIEQSIIYQISLVLFGIFALTYNYFYHLYPKVEILQGLVTLGFVINTFVIVVLFLLSYSRKIDHFLLKIGVNILCAFYLVKNKEQTMEKWQNHIDTFNEGAKELTKNKKEFLFLVILSTISLFILYSIPYFILCGMGEYGKIGLLATVVSSAYVMLIGNFVPIPGGTGGIEYGFVNFYGVFIKGAVLPALLLIWRFITYYFGLFFGAVVLSFKGGRKKCE